MHLDKVEIAAEVKEIEDNLKVKQNGFEMFKTNPNFRRVMALGLDCSSSSSLPGSMS
jgi:MFS transporter, SP family, galactose:H+ symporter